MRNSVVQWNVDVKMLTSVVDSRRPDIKANAWTAEQRSLDVQLGVNNVGLNMRDKPVVERIIETGKADAQRIGMGTSTFSLLQKPVRAIVTALNIAWCGKWPMGLFRLAMSFTTRMASRMTIGLRTWKRCLARSIATDMLTMAGASLNWRTRLLSYRLS